MPIPVRTDLTYVTSQGPLMHSGITVLLAALAFYLRIGVTGPVVTPRHVVIMLITHLSSVASQCPLIHDGVTVLLTALPLQVRIGVTGPVVTPRRVVIVL